MSDRTRTDVPTQVEPKQPLPRLTRRVFTDLAIWMTGLGILMGLAFPFFAVLLGVPSEFVLTPGFIAATVVAGVVVGASNQLLSRAVVGSKLRGMQARMEWVEGTLRQNMYSDDPQDCDPESCSLAVDSDDAIGHAAAAFNRLVEALAMSHEASRISGDFSRMLASHIELESLADDALREVRRVGSFEASALCIARDGRMVTVSSQGISDPEALVDTEPVTEAFRTLETVHVSLPADIQVDAAVVDFVPQSVVAYPLHLRMVPIGVLLLASSESKDGDVDHMVDRLLPGFAVALNNSLSHERLQQVAAIDSLTGLLNRRFGLERLSEEFSRAVRAKESMGVLLFDIDHFKAVNDTYGHEAGDRVLAAVAEAGRGVLREGDVLMRYGGEEFLAVLPGAGPDDLRNLAERVRRVIESTVVKDGAQELRVTVSVGAVPFPSADARDTEDLVRQADAAMYASKAAGRNRLTLAGV